MQQAIAQAETVLVILGDPSRSQNALFEAGMAVGMGKRVIVIADPGEGTPPPDLDGLLTIRARPYDLQAITFALGQAQGRETPASVAAPAVGHPLGDARVDELLALLKKGGWRERSVVEVLKTALEEAGTVTVERPVQDTGRRIDLGVWSDDLDAIALNPLLIEVKRTLSREAVGQTLALLQGSPMHAALLVHLDKPSSQKDRHEALEVTFPVLAIPLGTLFERLRTSSFAEVVRDLRNQAVHGVPAAS
ncbi:hypothetical protein [Streptomyces longwoodensis]|uniref:hypothetical protein n=1 Tax=Streptomyces longwoodensis TaxID=68231 RepID=UPI002250813F|nr:hypothetical protein [Streptomyces longwoodensis]MCX5000889.1 hypothetical protein [Streptomyces longwoodensis]